MANNNGNLDESISSDSDLEIIEEIPAPKKQKSGPSSSSLHRSQNGNTVIRSDDFVEYKQLVNGLNHRHRHTSTNSESDMPQDGRNGNGNTKNIVIAPKPTFALGQGQSSKIGEAGRPGTGFCPPAPAITGATVVAAPPLSTFSPSEPSLDVDKIKKSVRSQPEFAQYSTSNVGDGDGGGQSNGRSVARKSCSRVNPQRRPVSFMSTGAPTIKNYGNLSPQVSSSQELFRNPWRQTSGATPKTPSKKARNRRVIESSSSSDGSSASDDESETSTGSSSSATSSSSGSESTTSPGSDSDSSPANSDSENKAGVVSLQGQEPSDAAGNTPQVSGSTSSALNISTATVIRAVSRRTETETITDTGIETVTFIQTVAETETEQSVIATGTGTGTTTTSSTVNKKHKKKVRRESRHDVEVVDLFEDDDDEIQKYAGIAPIDMICHACAKPRLFKMKPAFIQHHRRHISRDHFQCPTPTCLRGFTSLTLCTDHEEKAHNKKKLSTNSSAHQPKVEEQEGQGQERSTIRAPPPPCSISATSRIDIDSDNASAVSSVPTIRINNGTENQTNNMDGEFEWSDEYAHRDEVVAPGASTSTQINNQINKKKTRIVPSTMLTRYRGHPVNHMTECVDIEEKHGLRNRTLGAMGPIQQQIQAIRNSNFDEEHDYFG